MKSKVDLEHRSYDVDFLPDGVIGVLGGKVKETFEKAVKPEGVKKPLERLSDIVGF